METKINVIFCGYRSWAKNIISQISKHKNINCLEIISDIDEYKIKENSFSEKTDIILFLGWSWIIPPKVTSKFLCLGIHPSDLPNYRGGSPLQHQIINGITKTKITLMTLSSEKLDGGDIWMKDDLDLLGDSMSDVFNNITQSSIQLLKKFFNKYPNIIPTTQNLASGSYFKRRKASESKVDFESLSELKLVELYNKIRCVTDPYPNLYFEDHQGNKLFITGAIYQPNE